MGFNCLKAIEPIRGEFTFYQIIDLRLSYSDYRKARSTLEQARPSDFEPGIPESGIQCLNHYANIKMNCDNWKFLPNHGNPTPQYETTSRQLSNPLGIYGLIMCSFIFRTTSMLFGGSRLVG